MGTVAPSNIYLFLVTTLVSFGRLDAAIEPCPTPCHCTLEILNCSRTTNPPGLHRVPFPKPYGHPRVFFFLDFTDNAISSIGKHVWRAYPWAEYLVLKGNRLSELKNTSLDGLLSLTHLDLSSNKIKVIEKNAFEPVPFLQFINLSGNLIGRITPGVFQAWHGMQFLLNMILSHNPLTAVADDYFYKLPSLKFLDLGATNIVPNVVVEILKTSIQLKTLILPKKVFCCLCRIQDDIEVLCETIKLDCTEACDINTTLCDQEGTLNKMQNEVMKVLETRKQNTRTILTVLPEKPLQDNSTLSLVVTQGLSHFGIHFHNLTPHIFTTVKQLSNLKADDFMDVTWADKSDLKKLYLLAKLLQAALKEKIAEYEKESQGTEGQKEAPTQVSIQFEVPVIRLKRYREEVKRENWFGKIPSEREPFPGIGTEFPKAVIQQDAEQQDSLDLHGEPQSRQKKLAWSLEHQSAASLLRPQRGVFQSSGKRSVSEAVTGAPSLTASIVMDENAADDLTGRVVIILKHSKKLRKPINEVFQPTVRKQEEETSGSQQAPSESPPGRSSDTENTGDLVSGNTPSGENSENLLPGNKLDSQTLQKDQEFLRLMQKEHKPQMPAAGTGTLNELSPDITLSQDTRWEHHEQPTTASPQATSLQSGGDYLLQGSLFEAEVNKRLEPLIPNVPVRNLISHVIRILKMDCTKPDIQMACAKLISKTGLLMKLFSDRENIKETYSLWQGGNMSTARPSNEGKPSDEISRQGILEYGYNSKLLLAISLTAVIMVIIAVICLIEICSHRSAKAREGTSDEKWSFLGRRKKSTPEKQSSVASSLDKPMWLEDMYRPVDNTQRKSMVDKLHDADSSDEEDIFNRASARASLISEPPPMEKRSSIKIEAAAPPPPPEEPLVKKASSKKLAPPPPAAAEPPPSEEATGEASSPKTAPSGDEGSEGTEGTSKKPSSEEEEEEEEED